VDRSDVTPARQHAAERARREHHRTGWTQLWRRRCRRRAERASPQIWETRPSGTHPAMVAGSWHWVRWSSTRVDQLAAGRRRDPSRRGGRVGRAVSTRARDATADVGCWRTPASGSCPG